MGIVEPFRQFSHLGGNTEECKRMLQVLNQFGCNDYGISFYLQKEIMQTPNSLEFMLNFVANNFRGFEMNFINVDGAKRPEEIDKNKLNQIQEVLGIKHYVLESGRYLVGNTIDMETTIIEAKQIANIPCVIIRNGIYSGLVDALL